MNGLSAITVLVVLDSIYKDQNNATVNTLNDPISFDERFTITYNNSLVDDQGRLYTSNLSVSSIDKKYHDDESLLPPSPPPTNEASWTEKYDSQDDIGNTNNDSLSSNDSKAPPNGEYIK